MFFEKNNTPQLKSRLRNILFRSKNKEYTIQEIFKREYKKYLTKEDAKRMTELIIAFLNKSSFRKPIDIYLKEELLIKQDYKCAFCLKKIDIKAHSDHIIPFKYVGDCLQNNWQLLCEHCNKSKNDSLEYQIKILLNLK